MKLYFPRNSKLYILALLLAVGAALSISVAPACSSSATAAADSSKPGAPAENFCGWDTGGSCVTDRDCKVTGCSSEVCQSVNESDYNTVCQWKDCYDPQPYGLYCGCNNGSCGWKK